MQCRICDEYGHDARNCPEIKLPPGLMAGKYCAHCYGMTHVRHKSGCTGCGEPWAPERIEKELPTLSSALGVYR